MRLLNGLLDRSRWSVLLPRLLGYVPDCRGPPRCRNKLSKLRKSLPGISYLPCLPKPPRAPPTESVIQVALIKLCNATVRRSSCICGRNYFVKRQVRPRIQSSGYKGDGSTGRCVSASDLFVEYFVRLLLSLLLSHSRLDIPPPLHTIYSKPMLPPADLTPTFPYFWRPLHSHGSK